MRSTIMLLALLLAAPGCHRRAAPAIEQSMADEEVKPVYPLDGARKDPRAERLCDALMNLPQRRRAQCCAERAETGYFGECVRMLSAALQARALKLDPAAAAACEQAMTALHAGCEWVGHWQPQTPPACLSLFQGTLPRGARCRSSLECAGALRCQGVGPTSAGVCLPARTEGESCGAASDALAVYTRQQDLERTHPECEGYCNRGLCAAPVPLGGECGYSLPCGPGRHCAGDRCVQGRYARAGEACSGGGCEPGARCHNDRCIVPAPAGAACEMDQECRGACTVPDGGKRGTCGMDCRKR